MNEAADQIVRRVLRPDGTLEPGAEVRAEVELMLSGLRWMMLGRAFDARAIALQRQGRVAVMSPVTGQEASIVGSALAFDPGRDWLVPQYRELPAYLIWGLPLSAHFLNLTGNPLLGRIPDSVRMLPSQVGIAAQLPHAVGIAWGLRLQRQPGVVLTYFGEGASSEGDFHEACNLAGVVAAPVVFFLQNNQWAISTPRDYQSAAGHLADRARGYGFPGVVVDGNDFLAVHQVTSEAVERARSGGGPTLIESITYRLSFHNTTDNPDRYRAAELVEEARKRDPIERLQRHLTALGAWDPEREREYAASIEEEIDAAQAAAAAAPRPEPDQMFENVFAAPPPRQEQQRRELLAGP